MTNEFGAEIIECMNALNEFSRSIADLLGSCDGMLLRHDWTTLIGNTVTFATSSTLNQPDLWYPSVFFRFYGNSKHPNILLFISIIGQPYDEFRFIIEEPVVTAGWFEYAEDVIVSKKQFFYWYNSFHVRTWPNDSVAMSELKELKKVDMHSHEAWRDKPKWIDEMYFESAHTFMVPLVAIVNDKDLHDIVVNKLLEYFKGRSE